MGLLVNPRPDQGGGIVGSSNGQRILAARRAITVYLALVVCVFTSFFEVSASPTSTHIRALAFLQTVYTSGTGFHVGGGCWVTAAHVVEGFRAVTLYLHSGKGLSGFVVASNESKDIAVIFAPAAVPALKISTRSPKSSEQVWALGFPRDSRDYGQVVPVVGMIHQNSGTDGLIWVSGVAFSGHSGSPVFDRTGHVVGMLVAVHARILDISFAVPARLIRQMVDRC